MKYPLTGHGPRLAVLFAAMLIFFGCGSEAAPPVTVGGPLPSFELERLEGGELSSDELKGRPTLLVFWATWCQPCLREIPLLRVLDADPRVELVTIALDQGGERTVAPFAEGRGLDYPILLGDQETFLRLGGLTIPYALLLDAQGQVVAIYRGPLVREKVEASLE